MEPVYYASNLFEAHLIQSFLEEHGVFSFTSSTEGSSLVGATSYLESTHPLYVYPDCVDEAKALLEEEFTAWRSRGESADEFDSPESELDEEEARDDATAPPPGALHRRKRILWYGVLLLVGVAILKHGTVLWATRSELRTVHWVTSVTGLLLALVILGVAKRRWGS